MLMPLKICKVLLYICLILSGCVQQHSKFSCGNSLFQVQTLMYYPHLTMFTWGQSDRYISAWIHGISTKQIQTPGCLPFLTLHHLSTLEYSTIPTKKFCSSKNFTQFDSLPLDPLHNIGMGYAVLVNRNKLKPVLEQLTQHNPVLRASNSCKLKYVPFDYFMHYNVIKYAWPYRYLGPHTSDRDRKWVKQIIKHKPV